jgi:dTDP-4-dehydrorhamnose 3,5-epimerase-like enzyme
MKIKKINLQSFKDSRGELYVGELYKQLPFAIKRIYFFKDIGFEEVRGGQAHKKLQQVAICLNGSCELNINDGIYKNKIKLDSSGEAWFIPNDVWREFTSFSSDCTLLILASELYDENDFINDFSEYLAFLNRESQQINTNKEGTE